MGELTILLSSWVLCKDSLDSDQRVEKVYRLALAPTRSLEIRVSLQTVADWCSATCADEDWYSKIGLW